MLEQAQRTGKMARIKCRKVLRAASSIRTVLLLLLLLVVLLLLRLQVLLIFPTNILLLRLLASLGGSLGRQSAVELGHVQGPRFDQALHEADAAHTASSGTWRSWLPAIALRRSSVPLLQLTHFPGDRRREAPLGPLLRLNLLGISARKQKDGYEIQFMG